MKRWLAVTVGVGAAVIVVLTPVPVLSHKPITTNILFKNEIAQIFQRKCFQCHSENNLSMSLTTYAEARPWARAIREEVLERKMPPWQAVPGYGHFSNDISLNTREKEIILSWADGGAPSGVLKAEESIPPVYVPAAPAWDHGTPDLVLPIGSGHRVASGAPFSIHRFIVETRLPASRRVRAFSLKQGDRRVVRHAAIYDAASGDWLGGWTPWQTLSQLPAQTAVQLAANARIAVEIGYSGTDQDVSDTSELGLYFDKAESRTADATMIAAPTSTIAAGATAQRIRGEMKLGANTRVLAFWPVPGDQARSFEVAAIAPDGMLTPLLWINEYRPEWRSPYLLDAALDLPGGSRLVVTSYFDNESDKPLTVRPAVWVVTARSAPRAAAPKK